MKKKFIFIFLLFLLRYIGYTQTYSFEIINQSQNRDKQLMSEFDSTYSFSVQTNSPSVFLKSRWNKPNFRLLPFVLTQQFNSHHPFGWNDGAMIQSKGYQVLIRPGVNIKYGIFETQIAPEFVFANNGNYPSNVQYGNPNNQSYSKIFLGQSFAKANLGSISIGASSENLWWGPGINSSLLMSNNAPGFLHAFIRTNKPIKTAIGNIEFNFIGGKLESTNFMSFENYHLLTRNIKDNWRYLNSYVISWQPKWVKGLFVGMARSLQQYAEPAFNQNTGIINKYFPVIGLAIEKKNNFGDDSLNRDQLASFFLRWVFPKSNFEFYFEYGKNDYGLNFRDYLMAPSHSVAYTIGLRKILMLTKLKYFKIETEITQMTQSPDYLVRDAGNWYEHSQIYQGYTQYNQILGAGAGFGANVQTISATWINGEIRNGFLIQRLEHDPINKASKWNDISIGWMPQWTYKNMILGAKLQLIHSSNYAWEQGNNPLNLHSRLMIQYNFK
jgi:hypothetical protein